MDHGTLSKSGSPSCSGIDLATPHRAHIDISAISPYGEVKVRGRGAPSNFRDLYDGWIEALSVQTLNKKFYAQLANWFFWSVKQVTFPAAALETDLGKRDEQNQIAVIRLLTRLIFVWFIKEKHLVPEALFAPEQLTLLLADDPVAMPTALGTTRPILQNLFFRDAQHRDVRGSQMADQGGGRRA